MTNEEHLKILKQGVEVWNRWREENPGVQPYLSGADLVEMSLAGVNLRGAKLNGAQLMDANLRRVHFEGAELCQANLIGANLWAADFRQADLSKANLSATDLYRVDLRDAKLIGTEFNGANLDKTNLQRADLSLADLTGAILTRTDLDEADFSGAYIRLAVFADTDLSLAKRLDTMHHTGPSTIGFDTINRSQGKVPEAFLRGCGLSDVQIEMAKLHNPDLSTKQVTTITNTIRELFSTGRAQYYYSCFISYSTHDQAFAERLYNDLQGKGVRCWFAPEDVAGGKKLYAQIDQAICVHDKLLLVLSESSIRSEWVMTEIRSAREAEIKENRRKLFPIRLVDMNTLKDWKCFDPDTGKDLAIEVREYFIPDFSNWENQAAYQRAFDRLLRDLKAEEGCPTFPSSSMLPSAPVW
jgi:hypothetical protein